MPKLNLPEKKKTKKSLLVEVEEELLKSIKTLAKTEKLTLRELVENAFKAYLETNKSRSGCIEVACVLHSLSVDLERIGALDAAKELRSLIQRLE